MRFLIGAVLSAAIYAAAPSYTYVNIPANNNIQSGLISTFPTGIFVANNSLATPFSIPSGAGTCGSAICNFYDGFGFGGNTSSITINVNVPNATDVYTLMNAYAPASNSQVARITFTGTGGASVSYSLVGGQTIRDYYQGQFANTLSNGVAGVTALNAFTCTSPASCKGSGATGNVNTGNLGVYSVDEQDFSLGAAFQGQTLTQITITDTNNGSTPILLGITIGSPSGAPAITAGGVVSASAFGGFATAAPGSWVEIYGTNLANTTRSWTSADFTGSTAPNTLSGTTVTIGGQQAFIDYISPTQVNAQIPSNVSPGLQQLMVSTAAGASANYPLTIALTQPGLLAPSSFSVGGTQNVVALMTDGVTYILPPGAISGVTSQRAKAGQTIVLYGVGFGTVSPSIPAGQIAGTGNSLNNSLQISMGGQLASVTYSGLAPGFVGLYQFNVMVPNVAVSDKVPVTFSLGGIAGTQTLYLAVGN